MKTALILLFFCMACVLPHRSFAIVYTPTTLSVQDSLKTNARGSTTGDKIAHWGQKSSVIGTVLFTFGILLVGLVEFQMRGGFLLLLLYGSLGFGFTLGLLGLILCIAALLKKDTTSLGRKKARTGLLTLVLGMVTIIVLATLLLN